MSSDKKTEQKPPLEETASDMEPASISETESEEHSESRKQSYKPLIFLFFITLLTAGYVFSPQQLKSDLLDSLNAFLQAEKEVTFKTPEPTTPPAAGSVPQTTRLEAAIEIEQPEPPQIVTASSDEVNRMLDAMAELQNELKSVRQEQQTIQETHLSLQKMHLRTRLHWITNRANHLPQLKLAWEEIALMPSFSRSEHETAQKMLTLAQERLQEMRNWQQSLQSHADSLTTPEHKNIIPEYGVPWLSWIRDYFSIKAAPSTEQQQDEQLRQQLLNTSRNIELEQWPGGNSWQQLRATLQLRLTKASEGSTEAIDLGLPESFDPLKADIEQLRQTAATWLEELS
ncbi:MAG: hypothetical protein K9M17_00110 [Mariprofundaceae bacterium]|nr:hypothetical protein [Mariprofundaceae bacterium]